jgi:hypothetical protein
VNGQSVVLGGTPPAGFTTGPYFVVASAGNTFQLSATFGGAGLPSTSTGTAVAATLVYINGSLIASSAIIFAVGAGPTFSPTSVGPAVPFFSLPSGGGGLIPRVRVLTNVPGVLTTGSYLGTGWDGVTLSVNLWSQAPGYANGDGGPYAVISGSANWLANYLVTMTQDGDGARGGGSLTAASEMALKLLPPGSLVYCDIQSTSLQAFPIVSQTFTIVPELVG